MGGIYYVIWWSLTACKPILLFTLTCNYNLSKYLHLDLKLENLGFFFVFLIIEMVSEIETKYNISLVESILSYFFSNKSCSQEIWNFRFLTYSLKKSNLV